MRAKVSVYLLHTVFMDAISVIGNELFVCLNTHIRAIVSTGTRGSSRARSTLNKEEEQREISSELINKIKQSLLFGVIPDGFNIARG